MSRDEIAETIVFLTIFAIGILIGVGIGAVGTESSIRQDAYHSGAGRYTMGDNGKMVWEWTGTEDDRK